MKYTFYVVIDWFLSSFLLSLPSLHPSLTPLPPSLPHSLPHSLAPSLTHSLTHSLTPPSLPPSLTPSLPHSLTPSLPHSLPPSLTLSLLLPSLPHSLTSLSVVEKFFEMKKPQCKEAIATYRKFITRQEGINDFLKLAEVGQDTEIKYSRVSLRAKRAFWCVQWHGFSIYLFQAVRRAVNVLNVSTCI